MRRRQDGQAAIEALAVAPLIALVVVIAWQLAVVVRGALMANEEVRARALVHTGDATVVTVRRPVPFILPGHGELVITARARSDVP